MAKFIIQFLLKTEKYQEDILDKRFEIGRQDNLFFLITNLFFYI